MEALQKLYAGIELSAEFEVLEIYGREDLGRGECVGRSVEGSQAVCETQSFKQGHPLQSMYEVARRIIKDVEVS